MAPLLKSKACERRLWRNQRAGFGAAVEKAEDQRFPDGFFAHRKGAIIEFAVALKPSPPGGRCHGFAVTDEGPPALMWLN